MPFGTLSCQCLNNLFCFDKWKIGFCRRVILMVAGLFSLFAFMPGVLQAQEATDAIEHEVGYYYTIQKGDTLWDLSEQFFDSPWYWPDLWHENNQIPNPHWIYPGQQLRLFRGESVKRFDVPLKAPGESGPKEEPFYNYSPIDRVGFVSKVPVASSGRIFKVQESRKLISQGDMVYIQPSPGTAFKAGDRYTIYRIVRKIVDSSNRSLIGTQHYLTGVAEITHIESQFAVATIIKSYRSIHLDDLLMPFIAHSAKIILAISPQNMEGRIIGFDEDNTFSGDNMVAFMDKGENDGIKPGQEYSIYEQQTQRIDSESKDEVLLNPVNFGRILVLLTQPTTSTVLITKSERIIVEGLKIGALGVY